MNLSKLKQRLRSSFFIWPIISFAISSSAAEPIRLHPENGHYLLFRGRAVTLVGSTEHYGALMNLDFDYIRYLDETRACGLNLVRAFVGGYRETPGVFNISDNSLSPAPGRSILPWARTQVAGAADGGNKFDLTKWDPAFFYRLRDFIKSAGERDIVVEITYFCPFYDDSLWNIYPMKAANHINGVGAGGRMSSFQASGDLVPFQKALIRKCISEAKDFDNVYHEPINEPYVSGVPQSWQDQMIQEMVAAQEGNSARQMIAQNIANGDAAITNPNPAVSIFNFHYASPNAALQNLALNRVIGDDETGFATGEEQHDFPYRREAWEFMLSGGGLFNHLDYSFTAKREDGLALPPAPGGGGPAIRRQLGVLRWFLEGLPLVRLTPQTGFIHSGVPTNGAARVIGVPGETYAIYVRGGTQANLTTNAPAGTYQGQWINPRSGEVVGNENFTHSGGQRILVSPNYSEDIALRLYSGASPPPTVTLTSPSYNSIVPANQQALELTASTSVKNGTIANVEFFCDHRSLGIDSEAPYQLTLTKLPSGPHVLRAKIVTTDGRRATSPPVKVTFVPAFHSGVNLNGSSLAVDGKVWRSEAEAIAGGLTITNSKSTASVAGVIYQPPPDSPTLIALGSHLTLSDADAAAELRLNYPLANGNYDVFLFVVEAQASYSRDMRVTLEGQTVAVGIGNQALGEWHKFGPYPATVTDSMLNLGLRRNLKGSPKIAGFSIYHAVPTTAAQLTIHHERDVVVISYPLTIPPLLVEAATTLADGNGWIPLNSPAGEITGMNVIPMPVSDFPSRFFRLRQN